MVGCSGDDHSIVVDSGDRFGCFWSLFPLIVLRKLRGAGRKARLLGVLREHRRQFVWGANLRAWQHALSQSTLRLESFHRKRLFIETLEDVLKIYDHGRPTRSSALLLSFFSNSKHLSHNCCWATASTKTHVVLKHLLQDCDESLPEVDESG
jgi:hypothetical protein